MNDEQRIVELLAKIERELVNIRISTGLLALVALMWGFSQLLARWF